MNTSKGAIIFTGISVQGRCYAESKDLVLFPRSTQQGHKEPQLALVYGKNGTGKSTLSHAVAMLDAGAGAVLESSSGLPGAGQDLTVEPLMVPLAGYPSVTSTSTLVFNEDFIESQVKLQSEGLETVVLFGPQLQLQGKLEQARAALTLSEATKEQASAQEFESAQAEQKAFKLLQGHLKASWAQRQRDIRGNSGATPVGKDVVQKISKLKKPPSFSISASLELAAAIQDFQTSTESEAPTRPWESLVGQSFTEKISPALLGRKLVPPSGEGLSIKIGQSLQQFGPLTNQASRVFADTTIAHCPMCQQDISDSFRAELLAAISAAVDNEAEEFSRELDHAKIPQIQIHGSTFDDRFNTLIDMYEDQRSKFNRCVDDWNTACEAKKLEMYSSVTWDPSTFTEAAQSFSECIEALEARATEINDAIRDRSKRQKKLEELNLSLSRYESDALVTAYQTATASLLDSQQARSNAESAHVSALLEVSEISAQLLNAQVAVDQINAFLRAIFAEADRLSLRLSTDKSGESRYVIRSRNRAVLPSRLSVGERNVVALAYFFTSVGKRLDELHREGSSDWLVVGVDDPISSMDRDSRLGIHGFIEAQTQRIFTHDYAKTKLLLLTHDLGVARELEKSLSSALFRAVNQRNAAWRMTFTQVRKQLVKTFELNENHELNSIQGYAHQNDYKNLLSVMWKVATTQVPTDDLTSLTIGNVSRRALEAFSTFIYDDASIPSPTLQKEYERVTNGNDPLVALGPGHRIFLHDSSHTEDRITAMSDFGGVAGLTPAEQIAHVQKLLAFMFVLQPVHMMAVLTPPTATNDDSLAMSAQLKEWCSTLLGFESA